MRFKKLVAAIVLMCAVFLVPLYTVRAESGINGNEAWIVAVINGTFQYEGRYYRAYGEYIAQATSYLCRDDVDLNETQAANAVDFIYRHIADGVNGGYLYEIDIETGEPITEATETTEDTEETSTEKTTDGSTENSEGGSTEASTDKDGKTTEASTDKDSKTTETSTDKDGKTTESSTDKNGKTTESSTDKDGKTTETSTEASTDKDGNTINPDSTTEDSGSDADTEQSSYATTDPEKYGIDLPVDEHGAIILDYADDDDSTIDYSQLSEEIDLKELVEYEGDGQNSKTGDRPDKEDAEAHVAIDEESGEIYTGTDGNVSKVEKYFPDWLVNIILVAGIIVLAVTAVIVIFAATNKCYVLKAGRRRKYKKGHTRRRKLRRLFRRCLTVTNTFSILIVMSAAILAFVLFRSDTVMQNLNKGGYFRHEYTSYLTHSADEITTNEAFAGYDGFVEILSYEEFLFKAKKEVSASLDGNDAGEKVLRVNAAKNIYDIKSEFKDRLMIPVVLSLVALIAGIVSMYMLDGIRSRGMRFIAITLVIAGMIIVLAGIALKIAHPHTRIYADPDYLYSFIKEVFLSAEKSTVLIGVFLTAVGFMSFGLYRSMRKREDG